MKPKTKKIIRIVVLVMLLLSLAYLAYDKEVNQPPAQPAVPDVSQTTPDNTEVPDETPPTQTAPDAEQQTDAPDESGEYTSKEEVAAYINAYGRLPSNYITKNEAKSLGWDSSKGNLDEVAPGKSIGGDRFGNYEELLPEAKGRKWTECDVNYAGGYRGGERIVFSNDGLIYYSADHYENFELLYGKES